MLVRIAIMHFTAAIGGQCAHAFLNMPAFLNPYSIFMHSNSMLYFLYSSFETIKTRITICSYGCRTHIINSNIYYE